MNSINVLNKATGDVIETLSIDDGEAVVAAVLKARSVQLDWATLLPRQRIQLMKRALREFVKDRDRIGSALAAETGKAPFDVAGEIFSVCQDLGHYAGKSVKWLKPKKVSTYPLFGKKGLIFYKPRGVVGVISPWNAPLTLAMSDILPALFAGNAVIVKPSEITPLAVKYAVEAFNRVLPDGVLQCLIGEGTTGAALVDEVDMVAVTGSCQTGKRVMERASQKLTPVLLELGGKDPMIVLKDADIERAANAAAWGSCFMTGQVCMSIERIYVEKEIASVFIARLKEKIQALRTGPDLKPEEMDYGPFIGPQQIGVVKTHIEEAIKAGAVIECGGKEIQNPKAVEGRGGQYFEPTLITGVTHQMKIMTEETFGPVACVMIVEGEEEAIRLANHSEYGLNASVWSRDINKGIKVATRLESGNVCVNDCILNGGVHSLPFGGIKLSGVGSRHGNERGLQAFCYAQSLMIEPRNKMSEMNWFPYKIKTARLLAWLTRILYGR